jgi:hypothetical protein
MLFEGIYQTFYATDINASVVFVWDWITIPAGNAMFALLQGVNGWELSPDEPIRWQGSLRICHM